MHLAVSGIDSSSSPRLRRPRQAIAEPVEVRLDPVALVSTCLGRLYLAMVSSSMQSCPQPDVNLRSPRRLARKASSRSQGLPRLLKPPRHAS